MGLFCACVSVCKLGSEINRNLRHKYTWKAIEQLYSKVLKCTKEGPFCIFVLLKVFVKYIMCIDLPSVVGHYLWEPMGEDCFQCSGWVKRSRFEADQTREYTAWSSRKCWLWAASSRTKCWPYANANCCHQISRNRTTTTKKNEKKNFKAGRWTGWEHTVRKTASSSSLKPVFRSGKEM